MNLVKHVSELAEAMDVRVVKMRKGSDRGGSSGPKSYSGGRRLIVTYGINTQRDYFIALHELGHIANAPQSPKLLEREANAWQWALDNALVEPSLLTKGKIAEWLGSYAESGTETPPEGHIFHTIIGWKRLVEAPDPRPAGTPVRRRRRLP